MERRDIAPMPTVPFVSCCAHVGEVVPAQTHLLRQMISADVDGSWAGFFAVAAPLEGGGGVLKALPLVAASSCGLFFLRAILQLCRLQHWQKRLLCCGSPAVR